MAKWIKVGVLRLSKSERVILVAVDEVEPHKWFIVDVGDLLDLISKERSEVDLLISEEAMGRG